MSSFFIDLVHMDTFHAALVVLTPLFCILLVIFTCFLWRLITERRRLRHQRPQMHEIYYVPAVREGDSDILGSEPIIPTRHLEEDITEPETSSPIPEDTSSSTPAVSCSPPPTYEDALKMRKPE